MPRLVSPQSVASAAARARTAARVVELSRFGSVGAVAYVVDVGLFNLLRFGPGTLLESKPLTAKVISVAVATVVAWLGNRYWTFAHRRTAARGRELVAFAVVNLGGLAIGLACLAVSHYALGLRSPLADNIAANGVGLVLGTAFRYVFYQRVVFTDVLRHGDGPPEDVAGDDADAATRHPDRRDPDRRDTDGHGTEGNDEGGRGTGTVSTARTTSATGAAAYAAWRDERPLRQDDVRVERPGNPRQEHGEHGRPALGELEPPTVGGDEVARKSQTEARPGA